MQKITPFLWFTDNAEEAANFYVSVFKGGKLGTIARFGEGMMMPTGLAMAVEFEIEGMKFTALNGRPPEFGFNESASYLVSVETQEEIDHYWNALIADGGAESMCGWLKDKYGVSWQIIPTMLMKMTMSSADPVRSGRAMQAMMQMRKIDIAALEQAYNA